MAAVLVRLGVTNVKGTYIYIVMFVYIVFMSWCGCVWGIDVVLFVVFVKEIGLSREFGVTFDSM